MYTYECEPQYNQLFLYENVVFANNIDFQIVLLKL